MGICENYGPLDFRSSCVRAAWSAILPAAFVLLIGFCSIPAPRPVRRIFAIIGTPFQRYLTLREAEAINIAALDDGEEMGHLVKVSTFVPVWRTLVFVFVGIVQSFCWVADGSYMLYSDPEHLWRGAFSFLVAISWLYTTIRPITRPTPTPPFDMFALYLILLVGAILRLGGVLFDHNVLSAPLPSTLAMTSLVANLLSILVLLAVTVSMPLAVPSNSVDPNDIVIRIPSSHFSEAHSPSLGSFYFSGRLYLTLGMDHVQLDSSARRTCEFIFLIFPVSVLTYGLQGTHTTLHENDVWNLSPTIQSRPIFVKFSSI
jgi:hypothetical protein